MDCSTYITRDILLKIMWLTRPLFSVVYNYACHMEHSDIRKYHIIVHLIETSILYYNTISTLNHEKVDVV